VRTAIPVVLFSLTAAAFAAQDAASAPAPAPAPAPSYYRIELAPSGSYVAIGAPVAKPTSVVFHAYPDGKLMMLRKTDVRKISPITAQEAAAPAKKDLVSIGNLAMQGGGAPAGASGVHTATSGPGVARGASSSGQGPAVVQTRDGLAITTGSTAAAAAVAGPAVTSTHDGMVVSAQPPHK
jgi:hypothetical protein